MRRSVANPNPGPIFTHVNSKGEARMVDVGDKAETPRIASAETWVVVSHAAWKALNDKAIPKGDVLGTARIAGIMAAKRTSGLVPLCHPLPLSSVVVSLELVPLKATPGSVSRIHPDPAGAIRIEAITRTTAQTGVEMEALAASSIAGLTAYDMLKAIERGIVVTATRLLQKSGGKSGDFVAPPLPD